MKWIWAIGILAISVATLVGVIWGIRHGYWSIQASKFFKLDDDIIIHGLMMPFWGVLLAIIVLFTWKKPPQS